MSSHKDKRKPIYYWSSRYILEEYFKAYFNMSPAEIDTAIKSAHKDFKVRKHEAIDMKDLWQKAGLSILKKHPDTKAYHCTIDTHCPYMNKDNGLCTWKKDCPFRLLIIL